MWLSSVCNWILNLFHSGFWQQHREKTHLILTTYDSYGFLHLVVSLQFPYVLISSLEVYFQNILAVASSNSLLLFLNPLLPLDVVLSNSWPTGKYIGGGLILDINCTGFCMHTFVECRSPCLPFLWYCLLEAAEFQWTILFHVEVDKDL